jgi:hypothetical protein
MERQGEKMQVLNKENLTIYLCHMLRMLWADVWRCDYDRGRANIRARGNHQGCADIRVSALAELTSRNSASLPLGHERGQHLRRLDAQVLILRLLPPRQGQPHIGPGQRLGKNRGSNGTQALHGREPA